MADKPNFVLVPDAEPDEPPPKPPTLLDHIRALLPFGTASLPATTSTRPLPILSRALSNQGVRVVVYIGDVFEESPVRGRKLADAMGLKGIKLIVLHDTADWNAKRDAEVFLDLARRTGGCVLPFDANAPARLRELLAAVAVYAVGGTEMLKERQEELPGAVMLLEHLRR